jgi:hypothetical protein
MSIDGLMLFGATALLQGADDAVPQASNEPIWLSADVINASIASGELQAGAFNHVKVIPPVEQWPAEWQHLKTKELPWQRQITSAEQKLRPRYRYNSSTS